MLNYFVSNFIVFSLLCLLRVLNKSALTFTCNFCNRLISVLKPKPYNYLFNKYRKRSYGNKKDSSQILENQETQKNIFFFSKFRILFTLWKF